MRVSTAWLFDLDDVVRRGGADHRAQVEASYALPPGTLAEIAFAPRRFSLAVTGRISDEDWRMSVMVELIPLLGDASRAVAAVVDWAGNFGRVDPQVLALIDELRSNGRQVALVVNGTLNTERELVDLGLDDRVDAIVNSARHGMAQPDAGIYTLAAGFLGVSPTACTYVGARAEHVAGAERVGMAGYLFDGAINLRAKVEGRTAKGEKCS
ncbi:MAG: HAD family hydrolase [Sporichthyaceae bacterium]